MDKRFAQVILPLSLHNEYTYAIPQKLFLKVKIGQRVIVQFGSKRLYAAIITGFLQKHNIENEPKEIIDILDENPIVFPHNIALWRWMSDYYCSTMGDIFRAAIPSGLKIESKSIVTLIEKEVDSKNLSLQEKSIVQALQNKDLSIKDLEKAVGSNFSLRAINSLIANKTIAVNEKTFKRYKPKTAVYIKTGDNLSRKNINEVLKSLSKAPKQQVFLAKFAEKTRLKKSIERKLLLKDKQASVSVLNALIKKGLLIKFDKEISRLQEESIEISQMNLLNQFQQQAFDDINKIFQSNKVALLHGITASGKTEIYIQLISQALNKGQQALYLLPEIALTTQLAKRIKSVFGNSVGIYHSRFNSQERVEVWQKVLNFKTNPKNSYKIIIGARSAIFLPFSNLGLVVVDEEHENSYKQFDPAPRYNARDTAIYMATQTNANVVLGSATPSYESFFNANANKYRIVTLNKRHTNVNLPEIIIADVKRAYKKRQMRSVLTPTLYDLINEALNNKEQVILFQNRRGYAPFIECFQCGWIPTCPKCSVSLTYHRKNNKLACHYCGFTQAYPQKCTNCGGNEIKKRGFGTEKVQEELKKMFKNARIDRMDYDTTQSKNAFERIITKIEEGRTDMLIGTQMVTKGLDFSNVSVVGILNADNLINFPDFRAHERAYQLISQVAGRAGRAQKRGTVVIQTSQVDHPLIELIKKQNYQVAFDSSMEERKFFKYPPYNKLIKISIKHKNEQSAERVAHQLKAVLATNQLITILGPEPPLVNRIKLWYIQEIWIKIDRKSNLSAIKAFILNCINDVQKRKNNSNIFFNIDVDPM